MYCRPRARGYARGWWARTGAIGFSTTFVGAIPEKSSYMNGVIYAVNKEELDDTDKRESGYTRDGFDLWADRLRKHHGRGQVGPDRSRHR